MPGKVESGQWLCGLLPVLPVGFYSGKGSIRASPTRLPLKDWVEDRSEMHQKERDEADRSLPAAKGDRGAEEGD